MEGGLQGGPLKISILLEGIYFWGPWNHPKSEKFGKKIIGPFLLHQKVYFFVGGWLFYFLRGILVWAIATVITTDGEFCETNNEKYFLWLCTNIAQWSQFNIFNFLQRLNFTYLHWFFTCLRRVCYYGTESQKKHQNTKIELSPTSKLHIIV